MSGIFEYSIPANIAEELSGIIIIFFWKEFWMTYLLSLVPFAQNFCSVSQFNR